ncbi:hypothetical protein HNQ59_000429 [Chitinivorax tropicus]|uniref:Ankyrin repeat domain-containing protein n=2 Tax=Chitinivorax tropicus TaxID=714531 RepID=A0A840MK09_9PROT|nr:hypothetical protein [Chitinivorax tropicus]
MNLHWLATTDIVYLIACAEAQNQPKQWNCRMGLRYVRPTAQDMQELNLAAWPAFITPTSDPELREALLTRFIDRGGNINATNTAKYPAYQTAPPMINGMTALHMDALAGNVEAVKLLLRLGADKTMRTSTGDRALDYALRAKAKYNEPKYDEVIRLLQ